MSKKQLELPKERKFELRKLTFETFEHGEAL